MTTFEAAVIGAGPAGLAAALSLAHVGVQVAVVAPPARGRAAGTGRPAGPEPGPEGRQEERQEERTSASDAGSAASPAADRRTTALLAPSIRLLANLGAWETCAPSAAPIAAVRIADDRGGLIRAPEILFQAKELGLGSFGANIANPVLLGALRSAAGRAPRIAWVPTAGVTGLAPGAAAVRLALAEGGFVEAALAVAADGRGSRAPEAAGIAVDAWNYPQAAVACSFGHSLQHEATVNELHRQAGPLTTVPLPGQRSGLVWVEEPAEARRLAELDDAAFAAALEERLQGVLGTISDVGPRAVHRLAARSARQMGRARVALVGEAAHVVAPIGAQGLNLGLRDAAALADCVGAARARGEDIGGDAVLAAYGQTRSPDLLARSLAIDLINRSLLTDLLPADMLRGLAAHAVVRLAPLRHLLMREGMGLAGHLPSLMR